ncbi:MAG: fluoride efflux transporter CrcB [Acidimicrobiales bacterium]
MIPAYLVPVMALGAVGAISRYLLDAYVSARYPGNLPWGTFTINMTGSFLLGLLAGLVSFRGAPDELKTLLGIGFCGAYTTFSTFSFESMRLMEERSFPQALSNIFMSLLVGLLAAGAGLAVGAWA